MLSTGNYRRSGSGGDGDDFPLLMYSAAATPREYYGEKRAKEDRREERGEEDRMPHAE